MCGQITKYQNKPNPYVEIIFFRNDLNSKEKVKCLPIEQLRKKCQIHYMSPKELETVASVGSG